MAFAIAAAGCADRDERSGGRAASAGKSGPQHAGEAETAKSVTQPIESEPAVPPSVRPGESPLRFTEVTAETRIDFVHFSGDNPEKPFPAANGSGVAAFDYDLDGWIDLFMLTGREFPLTAQSSTRGDQMYRNLGGWTFSNVTGPTGLGHRGYSAGVAVGDFNSDGFPDVYVNCYGPNELYVNQGDGTFQRRALEAGVDDPSWGTSCAWLDFDGDGDLDLYVCNYADWTWETNQFCGNRRKNIRIFCSPKSVKPVPDRFYENLGDGRFQDVLSAAGLAREPGRGQGVIAADLDQDGWIDLYVANDANLNFLFRNLGNGTFEDLTDLSGTGSDFAGRMQAGMGVDAADVDRDGHLEIFVTNYEDEHNAFYRSFGTNLFQDSSRADGLAAPSLKWVGWGTRFTDFDLDGWADLIVTNGHTDDNLRELGRDSSYRQPPLLFRNTAGRLKLLGPSAGEYFNATHPGRSLCTADFDRDGDPDVAIGHQDQPPALLRNDSQRPTAARIICLKLIGRSSNRDGIGAHIGVRGAEPLLGVQVQSGGSYLASHPYEVVLSLPAEGAADLEIRWPSGHIDRLAAPSVSGRYCHAEGGRILPLQPLIDQHRVAHYEYQQ